MKKKQFITETKRKQILAEKEKAIIESFAKNFNKIKRIDEQDLSSTQNAPDEVLNNEKFIVNYDILKIDLSNDELSVYFEPIEFNNTTFRLFFNASFKYDAKNYFINFDEEYAIYYLDNENNKFSIPSNRKNEFLGKVETATEPIMRDDVPQAIYNDRDEGGNYGHGDKYGDRW